MTETAISTPIESTPVVETTNNSSEVSRPLNNVKPYDMLDAYEEGADAGGDPKTEGVGESETKSLDNKVEETKTDGENNPQAKATKDDKVIDGVEELPIKRTINGKEVEFKIKDAIESHVKQEEFNRNMDKRINQISSRERAWKADQEGFREKIGKVIEVTQSGDFVSGIRALAKLAKGSSDLDVTQFEKMYFDQLEKVREVYTKMTPEQREAYFAKRSAAEAKAEADRLRGEKATTVAQSQLQQHVDSLMQQNGLAPDEFWGNYKVLVDSQVGEGKAFKDPNDIQAEDVVKYSQSVKTWEKVITAGQQAGVTDDAVLDEVAKFAHMYPEWTVEDITNELKKAGLASPSAVENLNRKVGKSRLNPAASSTKKQNGKVEGLDKEDLDFLYRKQPKTFQRPLR